MELEDADPPVRPAGSAHKSRDRWAPHAKNSGACFLVGIDQPPACSTNLRTDSVTTTLGRRCTHG
jgi:hypothetical protein